MEILFSLSRCMKTGENCLENEKGCYESSSLCVSLFWCMCVAQKGF